MSDPEKQPYRLVAILLRTQGLEMVKLFSKHGPRWMFCALFMVLGAQALTVAIVTVGLQWAMTAYTERGRVLQGQPHYSQANQQRDATEGDHNVFDLFAGTGQAISLRQPPTLLGSSAVDIRQNLPIVSFREQGQE